MNDLSLHLFIVWKLQLSRKIINDNIPIVDLLLNGKNGLLHNFQFLFQIMMRPASPKLADIKLTKKKSLIDSLRLEIHQLSNIDVKLLKLNNEIMEVESKCMKTINETEKIQNEHDMRQELWLRNSHEREKEIRETEQALNKSLIELQKLNEEIGKVRKEVGKTAASQDEQTNQDKK